MRSFLITARTKKGREAIESELKERQKMNPLNKVIFNKMFDIVIGGGFSSLEFVGKNKIIYSIDSETMKNQLKGSMLKSGCSPSDFDVEVKD